MATAKKETAKKTVKKTTTKATQVKKEKPVETVVNLDEEATKLDEVQKDTEVLVADDVAEETKPKVEQLKPEGPTETVVDLDTVAEPTEPVNKKKMPKAEQLKPQKPTETVVDLDTVAEPTEPVGDRPDPHGLTTPEPADNEVTEQPMGDPIGDRPDPHGGLTVKPKASVAQEEIERKAEEETDKLFQSNGIMLGNSEKKEDGEVKTVKDIIKAKEIPAEPPKKTSISKKISKIIQYMWNGQVMD